MISIGVDVAKQHLDWATTSGPTQRIHNTKKHITSLIKKLKAQKPNLVVIESTGGLRTTPHPSSRHSQNSRYLG